ncbi:15412_t:CDS:2 [Dentiscutata erythropus]|uniref:15412_t:CDS:1 n=1 Tax=Dentiscutata erythropus TaxID=1348616 RepID=A0A9N9CKC2_9GLOM|nr:15412_t:CDS:2 [Dentiscutata erythropus]
MPHEESYIVKDFISANDEIKVLQTLPNYQSSMYTSRLTNTKEIKLAYESAKFRDSKMYDLEVCAMQLS